MTMKSDTSIPPGWHPRRWESVPAGAKSQFGALGREVENGWYLDEATPKFREWGHTRQKRDIEAAQAVASLERAKKEGADLCRIMAAQYGLEGE